MRSKYYHNKWLYVLLIAGVVGLYCCKEPDTYGYLSDTLRYINDPWEVPQGVSATSSPLAADNSTLPLSVTLLDIIDSSTGKKADVFFKKYPTSTWKSPYDPATDTDLDKINAKREISEVYPLEILPATGQIRLSPTTAYVPQGVYSLDMQVKNPAGEKSYSDIIKIKLMEPELYKIDGTPPYFMALPANSESSIAQPYYPNWVDITKGYGSNADISIKRLSVSDNQRIYKEYSRVTLKILDKYGKPFPGEAIVDRASSLRNLRMICNNTIINAESVTYEFGVIPIPAPYWENQSNGYLNYYRIYDKYIASYDSIIPSSWNPPARPQFVESNVKPIKINIRFEFIIQEPGDWEVTLKLAVTRKDPPY